MHIAPVVGPGETLRAAAVDLDGVLTETAAVHERAWKTVFDELLARHRPEARAFDHGDYRRHLDGVPRHEGIRRFVRARGLRLPEGGPSDAPERDTVTSLGKRKNARLLHLLDSEGVPVIGSAVEQVRHWKARGMGLAVVSSSRNCRRVLEAAGLSELFDVRVDGETLAQRHLRGKPAPDVFIEAARRLGVPPAETLAVEDAIAGVQAARAAGFGLVVGVGPAERAEALVRAGADRVVRSLAELDEPCGPLRVAPACTRRGEDVFEPMTDWQFVYEGYDPSEEPLREALCTLGNGFFATRGAAEEASADDVHYPGTYLAAGYDRLETPLAGRTVENEDLVNWPNWLVLSFRPEDGHWLDSDRDELLEYRQRLDLRRGVLERRMHIREAHGHRETRIESQRIVSMRHPHMAAIRWTFTPLNWSGTVHVRSALDGRVINAGVARYRDLNGHHLEPLGTGQAGEDTCDLLVRSAQSHIRMAQAARTRVTRQRSPVSVERNRIEEPAHAAHELTLECTEGVPTEIEKVVALYTSRDRAITEPRQEAQWAAQAAPDFDTLLEAHERAWTRMWNRCELRLQDSDDAARIVRLHTMHLLQTVSLHNVDLDAGVPARGLHGEAYRGHIFWDEIFILPFLNLRIPEISRAALLYRYRRLPAARQAAAAAGLRGALFPWQSGSNGREESQALHLNPRSGRWIPDHTRLQRHINGAIAYNVWQYFQATYDHQFLTFYGAELLLEVARLWSSMATFNPGTGRYEIRGVVGPDEYHTAYPGADAPGLNNNAYTNVMAVWCLRVALRALATLAEDRRRELRGELHLTQDELTRWRDITRRMKVPFHDDVISQFEGYEQLEPFDWPRYRRRYGNVQRLDRILESEGDSPNRYQVAKQADVLMLFYLFSAEELRGLFGDLGYELGADAIPRNVRYYADRTSHGSTLSRVVHSWVLARSDRAMSWALFQDALRSDVQDIQGGTTSEGIHLGAMAGTIDLLQRCYTGIEVRDEVLWFNPLLPEPLQWIGLSIRYRDNWLDLEIDRQTVCVRSRKGWCPKVRIGFRGEVTTIHPGEERRFAR